MIRLAVRYDTRFCNDHGNGTPEGSVAFANTIIELMNPFFTAAPLCFKVELCNIEGSCSVNSDPYRNMLDNSNTMCKENDNNALIDNFKALFPQPPQGCDNTHLFFGGDPLPNDDSIGCAYIASLCDDFSVGVNGMPPRYLLIDHVVLVAHELGHSLSAEHVPENQFIMGFGDQPDSFKPVNINRMQNYVNQVRAQDSTCTATETAGPPTLAPTSSPCNGSEFRLVLQTDDYGEETSWEVKGASGNVVTRGEGYQSNSRFEVNECLPRGTDYTFTIRDEFGDGICCEFGCKLSWDPYKLIVELEEEPDAILSCRLLLVACFLCFVCDMNSWKLRSVC